MTIRLIGPLLCAGLLVLAMSIGANAAGAIVATGVNYPDSMKTGKNTKGSTALPKTQKQKAAPGAMKQGISDQAAGGVLSKTKK